MAGRPRKNAPTGGENIGGEGGANVTAAGTTRKRAGGTRRRKRGAGTVASGMLNAPGRQATGRTSYGADWLHGPTLRAMGVNFSGAQRHGTRSRSITRRAKRTPQA